MAIAAIVVWVLTGIFEVLNNGGVDGVRQINAIAGRVFAGVAATGATLLVRAALGRLR
jgi:hypothetical protein